ncbi:MAPEG family protein [Aeromicrobium sp.]|uniref:MAPEG family protein n=1 Tax=Aeromicrobium sp. TaxID=1871063 RepID=UPI002FC918BF
MSDLILVCIALLGLLVFVLGANVTRHRILRSTTGEPQAPNDPTDRLLIAVRAHGNAAEYIPTLAILLIVASTLTSGWWIESLAVAALSVRALHAFGMITAKTLAAHGPVRDIGAFGTYIVGISLAITVLANL